MSGQPARHVLHFPLRTRALRDIIPTVAADLSLTVDGSDGEEDLVAPVIDLDAIQSDREALLLIPESYARERIVIPVRSEAGTLLIACEDPDDATLLSEVGLLARRRVTAAAAPRAAILSAIQQRYSAIADVDRHVRQFTELRPSVSAETNQLVNLDERSPVVEIVNLMISQALRDRASDIHIEPQQERVRIRYRIDGLLTDALTLPKSMAANLTSRIKVMASMDIVDRHRAQDGQMRVEQNGAKVDVRVATTETIWGEKVVLRVLDQSRVVLDLDQLGLSESGYQRLRGLLQSPYGMIVASGPTGSGKTTSLYAAIKEIDAATKNIMTIEDPVEYTFENINQIQIRKMANLTFANGLKAILRQDPDVILVGEIRDQETAEIAIQSALTGHLVLSSLHATDSAGVIQRFIEMGIEGFLLSSALIGVLAQRLVRRICTQCRIDYQASPDEMALWAAHSRGAPRRFARGRGCAHCAGTGYRGRVGVFEVLTVTDEIKRLISSRASAQPIREAAVREGMRSMRQDAIDKVAENVTTLAEVIRCVWSN